MRTLLKATLQLCKRANIELPRLAHFVAIDITHADCSRQFLSFAEKQVFAKKFWF